MLDLMMMSAGDLDETEVAAAPNDLAKIARDESEMCCIYIANRWAFSIKLCSNVNLRAL